MRDIMLKINEIHIFTMLVIINSNIYILNEPILLFIIYLYIFNNKKTVLIFLLAILLMNGYITFIKFVMLINLFNIILQILKMLKIKNYKVINIYNLALFTLLVFTKICEKVDFLFVDLANIIVIIIIINIVYSCIINIEKKYKHSFLLALNTVFR